MTGESDLLRRAAQVARETADAAPRGPWQDPDLPGPEGTRCLVAGDGDPLAYARDWLGGIVDDTGAAEQTAAHIVLWHPGVALAVADWLDSTAEEIAADNIVTDTRAEAVARALLVGKESAPRLDLTQYWSDGTPAAPSKKGSDHD